jgi:hypothetical protein
VLYLDESDRQRLLSALMLLVMAVFVSAGFGPAARWRRQLRAASIVLFAIALLLALAQVAWWIGH